MSKPQRHIGSLTVQERDAYVGVKEPFTKVLVNTSVAGTDYPTSTSGQANKVTNTDDQREVGYGGWSNGLWGYKNYKTFKRVGFGKADKGNRGFFTDSDIAVEDRGYALGVKNGGAISSGAAIVRRSFVKSPIDAAWLGDQLANGNPSVVADSHLEGPFFGKYEGYTLRTELLGLPKDQIPVGVSSTINRRLTQEETSAASIAFAANAVIPVGRMFIVGGRAYQATRGGTLGSADSYKAWVGQSTGPKLTNSDGTTEYDNTPFSSLRLVNGVYREPSNRVAAPQPFATGPDTLELIHVGEYLHCDGLQVIRNGRFDFRNTYIDGYLNSCLIIQSNGPNQPISATPPPGDDFAKYTDETGVKNRPDLPCGATWDMNNYGVKIIGCVLEPVSNQWIYVNSNTGDPDWGTSMYGLYKRSTTSPVWGRHAKTVIHSKNFPAPRGSFSRPWGVTVINTQFKDRLALTTSNWGTKRTPTTQASQSYAGAIWTSNLSQGLLVHPQVAGAPRGDYAVFVRTEAERDAAYRRQLLNDGSGNPDWDVLEQRFQGGMLPGQVDARTWVVWDGNYDSRDQEILPTYRNSWGDFNTKGYWEGI